MAKSKYLSPTPEAGKAFYQSQLVGELTMLNLLKFRETADYTGFENLAPKQAISGRDAYKLYIKYTAPFIKEAGGEVIFFGKGGNFLIGPEEEVWDAVLVVKHKSAAAFLAFAQNKGYLKTAGHRQAGLEDSRLLPMQEGMF